MIYTNILHKYIHITCRLKSINSCTMHNIHILHIMYSTCTCLEDAFFLLVCHNKSMHFVFIFQLQFLVDNNSDHVLHFFSVKYDEIPV